MFKKQCHETDCHPAHEFSHIWKKAELPFLLDPENYPESWGALYKCPGVFRDAWKVVYMHPDCAECEDCAELALEEAQQTGAAGSTHRRMVPVQYPEGVFAEIGHHATVERT